MYTTKILSFYNKEKFQSIGRLFSRFTNVDLDFYFISDSKLNKAISKSLNKRKLMILRN